MKRKIVVITSCVFVALACKQNSHQSTNNSNLKVSDSVGEAKYRLKESIIKHSFNMPYSAIGSEDAKNQTFSNYFKVLDSLMSLYESNPLTNREQDLLSIFKAKNYFVLSKYSKGIEELKNVSKNSEFGYEKKALLAILYDYKGDSVMSQVVFKDLLSDFEGMEKSSDLCQKYFTLKTILGSTDHNICKGFTNPYKKDVVDRDYIIINNLLTPLEL